MCLARSLQTQNKQLVHKQTTLHMVIMGPAPTSAHPWIRQVCDCMANRCFGNKTWLICSPKESKTIQNTPGGPRSGSPKDILLSFVYLGLQIYQNLGPEINDFPRNCTPAESVGVQKLVPAA